MFVSKAFALQISESRVWVKHFELTLKGKDGITLMRAMARADGVYLTDVGTEVLAAMFVLTVKGFLTLRRFRSLPGRPAPRQGVGVGPEVPPGAALRLRCRGRGATLQSSYHMVHMLSRDATYYSVARACCDIIPYLQTVQDVCHTIRRIYLHKLFYNTKHAYTTKPIHAKHPNHTYFRPELR